MMEGRQHRQNRWPCTVSLTLKYTLGLSVRDAPTLAMYFNAREDCLAELMTVHEGVTSSCASAIHISD